MQQKSVFVWSVQEKEGGGSDLDGRSARFKPYTCSISRSKSQPLQPASSFTEQKWTMKEANPTKNSTKYWIITLIFVTISICECVRDIHQVLGLQQATLWPWTQFCGMMSPGRPCFFPDSHHLGSKLPGSFIGLGGQTQWFWPCSCTYQEEEDRLEPPPTLCAILG